MHQRPRPVVLVDVRGSQRGPFDRGLKRVNLSHRRMYVFPLRAIARVLAGAVAAAYLVFGSALAPVHFSQSFAAQDASAAQADRKALENQLADLESQITQYEATVSNYKKQGKSLQSEIDRLNTQIRKMNLQIKAVEVSLKKLDEEIVENKNQVVVTERELAENKTTLGAALRRISEKDNEGMMEIMLRNPQLSEFVQDLNNLIAFQDDMRRTVEKVSGLREELLDEQEQLAEKRADAATMKAYQDAQKHALQSVAGEKSTLLATTKGQESKYQELLQLSKKTAAQIRSQIFEFLGGGELSFEEAYQYAKVAEAATNVRAAMILAVLDRESALGQNVGKCKYNQVNSRSGKPAMNPTRDAPIFLALTAALAINPETVTVSCANADGAYGGAMGPAQFIPSTWNLYTKRVGELTGNNPPSPWRNADAFMASALYLRDSGAAKGATISEERRAAARYYAGGRWQRYLWTYGERVVSRAQRFQSDIDVLGS